MQDLTNQKFNKLTVMSLAFKTENYHYVWICKCECGATKAVSTSHLKNGGVKTCGNRLCKTGRKTHGMSHTRLYRIWRAMIERCTCETNVGYKNYGGRGIKVCPQWLEFINFYSEMKSGYKEGLSIDRVNNDGDYCLVNCKWSTPREQNNNRRGNKIIISKGIAKTCAEWSRDLGGNPCLVQLRIKQGWTKERAVTEPINLYHSKLITFNGMTLTDKEWSLKIGGSRDLVRTRLRRGWSKEKALTTKLK